MHKLIQSLKIYIYRFKGTPARKKRTSSKYKGRPHSIETNEQRAITRKYCLYLRTNGIVIVNANAVLHII